ATRSTVCAAATLPVASRYSVTGPRSGLLTVTGGGGGGWYSLRLPQAPSNASAAAHRPVLAARAALLRVMALTGGSFGIFLHFRQPGATVGQPSPVSAGLHFFARRRGQ